MSNDTTSLSLTSFEVAFLGCIGIVGIALVLALIWFYIAIMLENRVKKDTEEWE